MAQTPAKTKDHPDVKAMQERREQQTRSNVEAMARMESSQPTPTQEENDLAKLGVAVDDKEPDGAGPTIIRTTVVANTPLGAEPPSLTDPYSPEGKAEQERIRAERKARRDEGRG
jgi:hypothetical protein